MIEYSPCIDCLGGFVEECKTACAYGFLSVKYKELEEGYEDLLGFYEAICELAENNRLLKVE